MGLGSHSVLRRRQPSPLSKLKVQYVDRIIQKNNKNVTSMKKVELP